MSLHTVISDRGSAQPSQMQTPQMQTPEWMQTPLTNADPHMQSALDTDPLQIQIRICITVPNDFAVYDRRKS